MVWSLQANEFWTQTLFSGFFFFGTLKCNEMQMAVVRSKIKDISVYFVLDKFIMMSPFHLPFHLPVAIIINGAMAVETLLRRLYWTFHIYIRQTD